MRKNPETLFSPPRFARGVVDTTNSTDSCGAWDITPLGDDDPPAAPGNNVAFIATNTMPDFFDDCCFSYRFEGTSNAACTGITGIYWNTGAKCYGNNGILSLSIIELPRYQ